MRRARRDTVRRAAASKRRKDWSSASFWQASLLQHNMRLRS